MTTLVNEETADPRKTGTGLVDCDIHNELDSVKVLFPYLSARWRRHIEGFGVRKYAGGDYPRFWPPREEARPPSGRMSGSEVGFMSIDHLDRHDIAYGILIPLTQVGRVPNQDLDVALARAVNDWQVAEWLDPEPRLRASLVVPFEDPARAVEEIARRAPDRRFVQVQFTGRPHEPMGRRKYWPIYEACAEYGLHVMSHAFGSAGQPITGAGWASYYIEDHVAPPQAMQANIISMVIEGVFDRFPGVKVISVENGFGWLPSLMWRLDNSWRLLRDEVPHLSRAPSEYIREHVYLSTQPIEEPPRPRYFRQLFTHAPSLADRLLFASDYPHWDGDAPDQALSLVRSEDDKEKIFSLNARRLYRLP